MAAVNGRDMIQSILLAWLASTETEMPTDNGRLQSCFGMNWVQSAESAAALCKWLGDMNGKLTWS